VYKFEDNGNDSAGGLNLTASNMSYSSSGKFNKAAEFNGNNSNFTTTSISGLPTGSNPVSISYWVYTSTANQTAGLVGYGGSTNNKYFGTMLAGGDLFFAGYYYNSAFSPAVTVPLNQWNHLVWTFDGTNVRAYLNGSLAGTLNRSSLDIGGGGTLNIAIGKNAWSGSGSEHFNGKIDQVRIYNGKLEDIQVAKLYAETTSDNDNLNLGGLPSTIISANQNAGFSIVKWTGDGVQGSKVLHGLSAAPELIIMKDLSAGNHWVVGNSQSGWTKAMHLDLNNADNASNLYWNDTAPTSTVFSLGHHSTAYNVSGNEYIAYCFHSVSGYSKIGSYTGNGGTQSITGLGFQPNFVLLKESSHSESWRLFDSVRGATVRLYPDNAEGDAAANNSLTSFDSDGFSLGNSSGVNENNHTYIYYAF
jgi:hypothetical protein